MEVRKERPIEGTTELCRVGHFTMVAMGPDRKPVLVPPAPGEGIVGPARFDSRALADGRRPGSRSRAGVLSRV